VNIFINHISKIIGSDTQFESLVLHHDNYPYDLHFLDLKSFLAEGNLDKYAIKFIKIIEKQKGVIFER
jgi:hypothetical protein